MLSFLPVQRALFGGVAIMGGPVGPPPADLLLDFANGVYRKDGVTASFASVGGSFIGSPTVDGSGLTCTTTQRARIDYDVNVDAVWVVDSDAPAIGSTIFDHYIASPDREIVVLRVNTTIYQASGTNGGANQTLNSTTIAAKQATGFQGGTLKSSRGGVATQTSAAITRPDLTGATLYIGGDAFGSAGTGAAIRSVAIYKGTFTDAEIQALTA